VYALQCYKPARHQQMSQSSLFLQLSSVSRLSIDRPMESQSMGATQHNIQGMQTAHPPSTLKAGCSSHCCLSLRWWQCLLLLLLLLLLIIRV
jgi:hypothetical protein